MCDGMNIGDRVGLATLVPGNGAGDNTVTPRRHSRPDGRRRERHTLGVLLAPYPPPGATSPWFAHHHLSAPDHENSSREVEHLQLTRTAVSRPQRDDASCDDRRRLPEEWSARSKRTGRR